MKLSLFTAVTALVLSTSAYASCPDLAGTYSCPGESGNVDTLVEQNVVNGVTVYTVTDVEGSYDLIADGVTRTQSGTTQTGNSATINEMNRCDKDTLHSTADYNEVDPAGKSVSSFKMSQSVWRDAATGGLALTVRYSENGGAEQVGSGVCAKK